MKKSKLQSLNNEASGGEWCQWHPSYYKHFAGDIVSIDTSHHMSTYYNGKRYKLSEWQHSSDAYLAQELVNAFRSDNLIEWRIDVENIPKNVNFLGYFKEDDFENFNQIKLNRISTASITDKFIFIQGGAYKFKDISEYIIKWAELKEPQDES